jgi:hypothetical protein
MSTHREGFQNLAGDSVCSHLMDGSAPWRFRLRSRAGLWPVNPRRLSAWPTKVQLLSSIAFAAAHLLVRSHQALYMHREDKARSRLR